MSFKENVGDGRRTDARRTQADHNNPGELKGDNL